MPCSPPQAWGILSAPCRRSCSSHAQLHPGLLSPFCPRLVRRKLRFLRDFPPFSLDGAMPFMVDLGSEMLAGFGCYPNPARSQTLVEVRSHVHPTSRLPASQSRFDLASWCLARLRPLRLAGVVVRCPVSPDMGYLPCRRPPRRRHRRFGCPPRVRAPVAARSPPSRCLDFRPPRPLHRVGFSPLFRPRRGLTARQLGRALPGPAKRLHRSIHT